MKRLIDESLSNDSQKWQPAIFAGFST